MTQAQLHRDAAFQATLASISFDLFPRRDSRRRLDYDLSNRCASAGPELESPVNVPDTSVVVPQHPPPAVPAPVVAPIPATALIPATSILGHVLVPINIPQPGAPVPHTGIGYMVGSIRGTYMAPAVPYAPTLQVSGIFKNKRGNSPPGVVDAEWATYYNRADSRIYNANGGKGNKPHSKQASKAARNSGETRAVGIWLLMLFGFLPQGFVDGNA